MLDEKVIKEILVASFKAEEIGELKPLGGIDSLLGFNEKILESLEELCALKERKKHLSKDMEENWREVDSLKDKIQKLNTDISKQRELLAQKCGQFAKKIQKFTYDNSVSRNS